jgi:excisionase family DNA binding protein
MPMPTNDEWPELVTVKEVARVTRLSPMTIYRLVRDGTLDATRAGRSIRVHADSVRRLVKPGG